PKGAGWESGLEAWRALPSDPGALVDREVTIDARELRPYVSWGTNPGQTVAIDERVPDPAQLPEPDRAAADRALRYMALRPGTPMREVAVDAVFLGSCTNARIEDLRAAAGVVRGRTVNKGVRALVVPGSAAVKAQAEREGLDGVFRAAGFEWRDPGCSMCLGMNPDVLRPGERCASTSNRNFGCSSSREHAVWALQEFGFRAVIAPTMADIFRSNSIKNGLVPVELNADAVSRLLAAVQADANTTITVDVAARTVAALGVKA